MSARDKRFLSRLGIKQSDVANALGRNDSTVSEGISGSTDYLTVRRATKVREHVVGELGLVKDKDFEIAYEDFFGSSENGTDEGKVSNIHTRASIWSSGFVFVGASPSEIRTPGQVKNWLQGIVVADKAVTPDIVYVVPHRATASALLSILISACHGCRLINLPKFYVFVDEMAQLMPNVYLTGIESDETRIFSSARGGAIVELEAASAEGIKVYLATIGVCPLEDDYAGAPAHRKRNVELTPDLFFAHLREGVGNRALSGALSSDKL